MGYVAQHGYPVPRVEEISADGSELVMERIDGPTMFEVLSRHPWTLWRHASVLAALHEDAVNPADMLENVFEEMGP